MAKMKLADSSDSVIRDYDEFCAKYERQIRNLVIGYTSFQPCDVDDIVQDLMTDFFVKDALGQFDPTLGTRLSTWVHGFVARRVLGKRDRVMRYLWREGLSLHAALVEEGEHNFLAKLEDAPAEFSAEFLDTVRSVYRQLSETPVTGALNDFPKLFACLVQQIVFGPSEACRAELGERQAASQGRYGVSRKVLAYELGVSESGVAVMLNRLAENPVVVTLLGRS